MGQRWCSVVGRGQSTMCWFVSATLSVCVDADGGLVRKQGACLVEGRREASVVGQQGQSTTILFITL